MMTREGVEGGVAPTLNDYMDRATPFEGDLCSCADCADKDDCGPDDYMDLSVYFPLPELIEGLKLYEAEAMTVPLKLIGTLKDGTAITGMDCVNVIKCDGDFDCDKDIDGKDAMDFKKDFGRSLLANPCTAGDQCLGDFDGDQDIDGMDANAFKRDFGRSSLTYPCNGCCSE